MNGFEPEKTADRRYCFISYARDNVAIVRRDAERLRYAGVDAWYDTQIQPGADWPEEIANAIEGSRCVVFFVSSTSVCSVPCLDEVNFGLNRAKPLLAIYIEATDLPPTLEFRIGNRQAIFRQQHSLAAYDELLADAVKRLCALGETGAREPAPWALSHSIGDRPSIAVMPLLDQTNSAGFGGIADGITNEITTLLARIPELFVISHASTRSYRDRRVPAREIHKELGVRFVLEGSIRSIATRLRLDVELIDALTNQSIWDDRFEVEPGEILTIQDEVAAMVCARLELKVRHIDMKYGQQTGNLAAWRLWQQGWMRLFIEAPSPAPEDSLELFLKALNLDSKYTLAHAGVATAIATGVLWGGISPKEIARATRHAEIAFKDEPDNPAVLYALTLLSYLGPDDVPTSLELVSRAVEREPSNAVYQCVKGFLLSMSGHANEGVDTCLYGMRLSPKDSREPFMCYMLGNCHIAAENFAAAIKALTRSVRFSHSDWALLDLAFAHFSLGDESETNRSLKRAADFGTRPLAYYAYAMHHKLWPQIPGSAKNDFLMLCRTAGLK